MNFKDKILTILCVVLIMFYFGCGKKSNPVDSQDKELPTYEQTGIVDSNGGIVKITDDNDPLYGTSVEIPSGALKSATTITINNVTDKPYVYGDTSGIVVSLEPDNIQFEETVKVTIPYQPSLSTSDLAVYYFDDNEYLWIPFSTSDIDEENHLITAETNHFCQVSANNKHVDFDVELYQNQGKITAEVILITPMNQILTDFMNQISGIGNIRLLLEQNPYDLRAHFRVILKEKKAIFSDPSIDTTSIRYEVYYQSGFEKYEVRAIKFTTNQTDGDTLLKTNNVLLDYDGIETYYSGEPILFSFDKSIDLSKAYYVEIHLYYIDRCGYTQTPGERLVGPHGIFHSTSDVAKTLSEMTTISNDEDGDDITDNYDDTIGLLPVVIINSPSNGASFDQGESITFSGSATDNEDGQLTGNSLIWSSNLDGNIGSSSSFTKSNLSIGTHEITLKATDSDENTNSARINIEILSVTPANTPPVASFTVSPTSAPTEALFSFDASSSSDNEDLTSSLYVRWDWENDGAWDTNYSLTKAVMHQYSTAGIKTIKLEVIDTGGLTSTATQQITVTGDSNTQPIASFTVTPFSGNTDTQFSFDASECTDNEDPLSLLQVRWDWENDGTWDMNYSTAKTATHQYVTEGTKTIKLEVIDTGGLTNSTTNQISVINIQKADLKLENINMSPTSGSSGTSVSLTFDVRNIGSSTAGGYRTKIYWSTDTDIGGGDLVLADTLKTNNTPVNYYARFPMHVTVPSDYSLGTYYIGIHIDTDNQVSETDESNNKDHKPFNISGSETGTVMDIDGNVYQTVKIGNQWWMAENLKVTHYRNGDTIQNVIENSEWASLSTGAYCVYNNDEGNVDTYGRLYNWYAVNDERKIAPQGWHVSTNEDWQTLADYLGGESVAGGKLKETGTSHWFSPNTGATNESGFTALPGGARRIPGDFFDMGGQAHFRSATERNNNNAYYWTMYCVNSEVRLDSYYKQDGFSVRCVKD